MAVRVRQWWMPLLELSLRLNFSPKNFLILRPMDWEPNNNGKINSWDRELYRSLKCRHLLHDLDSFFPTCKIGLFGRRSFLAKVKFPPSNYLVSSDPLWYLLLGAIASWFQLESGHFLFMSKQHNTWNVDLDLFFSSLYGMTFPFLFLLNSLFQRTWNTLKDFFYSPNEVFFVAETNLPTNRGNWFPFHFNNLSR